MYHLKRVGDVAHMLRHLVALGIEDEAGGDDVLKRYVVEDHRGDGVQGEEPAACLVDALVDEVGRIECRWHGSALIGGIDKLLTVFGLTLAGGLQTLGVDGTLERIVLLRVRHGTRVEPYVDKVGLAAHRLAVVVDKDHLVDIRTVEVYLVVVLLGVVAGYETAFLQRVLLHHTGLDALLYLSVEFLYGAYALLSAVLVAPDRQRRAPET